MSQTILAIYVANDNLFQITITNGLTGATIDAATVTATLKDSSGANVSGETWPKTMTAIGSGVYRATLIDTLSLNADENYTAHIDADAGADLKGHWEVPLKAETRVD